MKNQKSGKRKGEGRKAMTLKPESRKTFMVDFLVNIDENRSQKLSSEQY
jgi:hypothetical protein